VRCGAVRCGAVRGNFHNGSKNGQHLNTRMHRRKGGYDAQHHGLQGWEGGGVIAPFTPRRNELVTWGSGHTELS
jgi:hypothetical protein